MALLILIAIAAALSLWLISLFRILLSSGNPSKPTFLSNGPPGIDGKRRNILLVIAHPDDESMFFAPTLLYLTSKGHNVHILCLSTGNADGKGVVRQSEFYGACAILMVPFQQVKILDNPDLQDGFNNQWDRRLIATIVEEEVKTWGIDSLITFDKFGVSGHPNHCSVHHGICMFLWENSQENIEAWELISTSILRKYSGPMDIWLSNLNAQCYPREQMYCLLNARPYKSYLAMAAHYSQWVWFRKLFVLLSSYTYMNTLQKINP